MQSNSSSLLTKGPSDLVFAFESGLLSQLDQKEFIHLPTFAQINQTSAAKLERVVESLLRYDICFLRLTNQVIEKGVYFAHAFPHYLQFTHLIRSYELYLLQSETVNQIDFSRYCQIMQYCD